MRLRVQPEQAPRSKVSSDFVRSVSSKVWVWRKAASSCWMRGDGKKQGWCAGLLGAPRQPGLSCILLLQHRERSGFPKLGVTDVRSSPCWNTQGPYLRRQHSRSEQGAFATLGCPSVSLKLGSSENPVGQLTFSLPRDGRAALVKPGETAMSRAPRQL